MIFSKHTSKQLFDLWFYSEGKRHFGHVPKWHMYKVFAMNIIMKLMILEDEPLLLEKYTQYLQHLFTDIRACTTVLQAKEALAQEAFHVLLIDYNLPDGNGLDIIQVFDDPNDAPVSVMITAYSKEKVAIQSLNLGVFKYLEKPVDKNDLIEVIEVSVREAKRRAELEEISHQFLISEKAKKTLMESHFITPREIEVLKNILIHGKNNKVALILEISQGTVKNHLSNIFQKLHVANKDELKSFITKCNS